ncbi:MAG: DsbA family protein [Pseudorhodobacter sp.]
MRKTITALAALLLGSTAALADMTDAERQELRDEVRAYLLEDPEILMEAFAVLEDRRNSEAAAEDIELMAANADEIFNDPASWSGGNPDGDITVVEFIDYRCGYCRRAYEDVEELIGSDGNIRFVVKEFPILGEQSEISSRFAISVLQLEGAEAYKKAHNLLIEAKADLTPDALTAMGADLGLADTEAVIARMQSPEVSAIIDANHALGQRLQINGTPTFVIDQTMVRGYVPLDGMRQIVEQQRKEG